MVKAETVTFEYEHCGECPSARSHTKWGCSKKRRVIKDLWGEIPEWCPLEDKGGVLVTPWYSWVSKWMGKEK